MSTSVLSTRPRQAGGRGMPARLSRVVDAAAARATLTLSVLVVLSSTARVVASLFRSTPLLYPDEFVYSSMARGIVHNGLPQILGHFIAFPALLVPYLMAPAWLVDDVRIAYHLTLGIEAVTFSLAAVPAYLLARKLGVGTGGALLVAALTLLVPDAAFTTVQMTEPFAYPLFLAVVLVAVETLTAPTYRRQAILLALMGLLVAVRFQFVLVPVAYGLVVVGSGRSRRRLGEHWPVLAALLLGGLALVLSGIGRGSGYYGSVQDQHVDVASLPKWAATDLFVLAVASGWVIVPGAVTTLGRWARRGDPRQRSFALLSFWLALGLLAQVTWFGAVEGRVQERYLFYLTPLLAVAFAWGIERLQPGRTYTAVAYAAAAAAILVPVWTALGTALTDQSPTVMGVRLLGGNGDAAWLAGSLVLAIAAVAVAMRALPAAASAAAAVTLLLAIGTAGTVALVDFGPTLNSTLGTDIGAVEHLGAPPGSVILADQSTSPFLIMKTLFWNRGLARVAYLGTAPRILRAPTIPVSLSVTRGLLDAEGKVVPGPYAVPVSATWTSSAVFPGGSTPAPAVARRLPTAIVFGLDRVNGRLQVVSHLVARAADRPEVVRLRLVAVDGPATLAVACAGQRWRAAVATHPTDVAVPVRPGAIQDCRLSLVRGRLITDGGSTYGIKAVSLSVSQR